ncbi:MFS transporter [Sphingomonas gilva]|uniref:MFS transporter n=1 Tax=Sphingomonas gilva TaxID=2305907 RepID=A0A396RZV0_9SPHN|nr:MFS transporter [Sphingomonas gilva]RHW19271.1 MFS transporter [Sphingomonas gilva]
MADAATRLPPTPRERWTRYQWLAIGLLLLVNISSALDRYALSNLQEHLKVDLQLTDTQLGFIAGPAFSLFYTLSAIPIARLAERVNRARLLAAVLSFWSGATALCGAATGFVSLALCRMGVGMGEGGCHPISQSTIADSFAPRQRGSAMAIYAAGPPIAAIVAPVLTGAVAHWFGWRVAFLAVGLPGLALAVVLWAILREPRHAAGHVARPVQPLLADLGWAFRNRAFLFIFIAGAFNGIGITGIGAFTTSFVMRTQGFNIASAGLVVGALGAMGLVGTFLGGWLADRFADSRGRSYVLVCATGALLSFIFYLIAFSMSAWPLVLLGLLSANLATDLKNGPNFAAIQNIVPSHMRATAAAIFTVASNVIGMGLGALLVGLLSDALTAQMFGDAYGAFTTACPGGHAPAGATAALADACRTASAEGLRLALGLVTTSFLGAAFFFWLANRHCTINEE